MSAHQKFLAVEIPAMSGRASILLIEDEALIRMMLVEMIEELGHKVVAEAGNVDEARSLARQSARKKQRSTVKCSCPNNGLPPKPFGHEVGVFSRRASLIF
jgi:CheY-like chemotaxis protein